MQNKASCTLHAHLHRNKFSKYTSLTNFMQICPLAAAQQCHANGRQNEANSCDQHHTQESNPVTIVRGLGGPVYMSIEKIISCTCWGQTPDHPAHSKSLHQYAIQLHVYTYTIHM